MYSDDLGKSWRISASIDGAGGSECQAARAQNGSLLLVQCDPRAASLKRVEHARYICEKTLSKFMRSKGEEFFVPEIDGEPEAEAEHFACGWLHSC